MSATRIGDAWETYYVQLLAPYGVTRESMQYQETRRAFYGGAMALLGAVATIFDASTPEPTEEDLNKMDEIEAELRAFSDQIAAGKA